MAISDTSVTKRGFLIGAGAFLLARTPALAQTAAPTTPSPQEIRLYDVARMAGIDINSTNEVRTFLESYGIRDLPPQAHLNIVISTKNPGRIYVDSTISGVATTIKGALGTRGIEATVDTSDNAPKSGSSVFFDGHVFEDYAVKLGGFLKEPKALERVFLGPISDIIASYPAHTLSDIRALNLLQEAGQQASLFPTSETRDQTRKLLVEASKLMSSGGHDEESPVRRVEKLVKKLEALEDIGTAPRSVKLSDGTIVNYAVDAKGTSLEKSRGGRGLAAIETNHDRQYIDFTLTKKEAAPLFQDAAWSAAYNRYYELFKKDGMSYEIADQHKGTLGDFLQELTNPRSAMAVALKRATLDKGAPENPVQQAGIIEGAIANIYEGAALAHPRGNELSAGWLDGAKPWLSLEVGKLDALLDEADKFPKNASKPELYAEASRLLEKYVGKDALERAPARATTRPFDFRTSPQVK